MSGSATTVRWLLREGLLDELNLLVHPVAVGAGLARLFPPDEPTVPLELLSSETFTTGVLNLSYGPAGLSARTCRTIASAVGGRSSENASRRPSSLSTRRIATRRRGRRSCERIERDAREAAATARAR